MHPKDFKALIKECVLDVLKENLSSDKVSIVNKYKKAIYSQLEALKFRRMGNTPRDYMEYYKYNFATVQVSVDVQSNTVRFEKFFDNELLADNNFVKELPLPTNIFSDDLVHSIVNFSKKLKTNIDHDYPIFGGIDEAFDPTSVGPNPEASEGQSVDNPYAAWNAKMRTMEENQDDGFNEFRQELGADKVNEFLAKFGLGPNYKPAKRKTYPCPKCKKTNAVYKEEHADTDMNEMVLECPDCGHCSEDI